MITTQMTHSITGKDGELEFGLEVIKTQRSNVFMFILKNEITKDKIEFTVPFHKMKDFVKSANKIHINP